LKADKAASGAGGGFSLFGGKTEKWENAADLYTQAANAFRMQKQGSPFFGTKDLNVPTEMMYQARKPA